MSDSRRPPAPADLASIFLGPKGENAEEFERLLLDAFRDHVFWRRNFHPEDGFQVEEVERQSPEYRRSIAVLRQEMLRLLGELKGGVPFFSPRYIGHMASDLTMAGLVGYFATMLYNPNNVAAEASPVTSRMELEVAGQLAVMIGYAPDRQWGHLTSGGTVANFEALWVARNVKYLPVALRWAAAELGLQLDLTLANGETHPVARLGLWELLNVTTAEALNAGERFRAMLDDPLESASILARHTLAGLGYQDFGRRLARDFGDSLPPAAVLVPSTAHYSWEKICRSLGIGSINILQIPVDQRFRMDTDALQEALHGLSQERRAIIACVSVIGTTEESAVDRLDRIVEIRRRAESELGMAFHLHADAAWGGYAASITWDQDGRRREWPLKDQERLGGWPEEGVFRALTALEETDSVTIDPHKLGFIPYPAGAISLRDGRSRDLVAVEAPYLFHRGASEWGYIGRYIFEGSKPGASAAAVWMSHKVLPLDATGYGRLIGQTAHGAMLLHRRLRELDWGDFRVVPLPEPDLNIVCFGVGHPALPTLEETNEFVARVYAAMSVRGERRESPDYFVTKTILRTREYGRSVLPLLRELGFTEDEYLGAGGLSVIRCTVMDPLLAEGRGRTDHVEGFTSALHRVFASQLEPASAP